jgi:phosphoglucomutase
MDSRKIKELDGKKNYVIGGEESFGLMIGNQIRDKDAVSAVALCARWPLMKRTRERPCLIK